MAGWADVKATVDNRTLDLLPDPRAAAKMTMLSWPVEMVLDGHAGRGVGGRRSSGVANTVTRKIVFQISLDQAAPPSACTALRPTFQRFTEKMPSSFRHRCVEAEVTDVDVWQRMIGAFSAIGVAFLAVQAAAAASSARDAPMCCGFGPR